MHAEGTSPHQSQHWDHPSTVPELMGLNSSVKWLHNAKTTIAILRCFRCTWQVWLLPRALLHPEPGK